MNHTSPRVDGVGPRSDVPRRRYSGRSRLAAGTGLALLGGLLVPGTSSAAVTIGSNISVFPNRDMVVAVGYEPGERLKVEVLRNDVVIGSATGPAVDTPEGTGVEVNHGPLGAPQPGDCWDGYTPDIIGGDVVRVTPLDRPGGGSDTMTVQHVDFTEGPYLNDDGSVSVAGTSAAGTGFAVEFRRDKPAPRFRRGPFAPVFDPAGTGAWTATFRPSTGTSAEGLTPDQQRQIALTEASWMAVADNVTETTLAELGEPGGVGPGCTGTADPNSIVGGLDPVNIGSGDIVLSGTAKEGTPTVDVTVGGLGARAATLSGNATGNKTWTVPVTKADLMTLPDGSITVTPSFGGVAGAPRTILKDTVAPGVPTATPAAGTYTTAQQVALQRAVGEASTSRVRYEIGGSAATTPDPDPTSPVYSSQIAVTASQTIKARVFDAAGNAGALGTFTYLINPDTTPPPAPVVNPASGSYAGPRTVDMSDVEAGVEIRYAVGTGGTVPPAPTRTTGTVYSAPFSIDVSQNIVAVAFDAAGNASPATTRTYTITMRPTLAPNIAPDSGTYTTAQQLVMSSPEAGVRLRYTTGTATNPPADPTATTGALYTGPVTMNSSRVIKAAAFNSAGRGPVAQRSYTINLPDTTPPPAPAVNPASGTYTSTQSVTMGSSEAGAVIRYTVGTGTTVPADPTATSAQYTGALPVSSSRVIKAAAFDAAGNRSAITQRSYTISNSAPRVTGRAPGVNATGVGLASNVTATFSEAVQGVSSSTFRLTNQRTGAAVAATVTRDGTTNRWILNPGANLAADTRYTVTLTGGPSAIRDLGGAALTTTSWDFVTGPRPTVTLRSPAAGATAVSRTTNVTATFSEAVQGVSGTTFRLTNPAGTVISAVVSKDTTTTANRYVLNPSVTLAANTAYRVSLTGGTTAIRDAAGNGLVNTGWSFTTGG